jgi:hypothetical protein
MARRHERSGSCSGGATVALACGVFLWACEGGRATGAGGHQAHGSATLGGAVVSTVDGHPVSLHEVEGLVHAGLSPREALRRLQAERLLMTEAERRGFGRDPEVRQVGRQALVQALLVAEAESVHISDDDVRRAYEQQKARFDRPERRASVHVLAKLPKQPTAEAEAEAKAFATRMLGELAVAPDPQKFIEGVHAAGGEPFQVVAEKLPLEPHDGDLVKPFLDALFSVAKPGVLAEPVRTSFGWHAVRVTEIIPAEVTPYESAAPGLRGELLLARRQQSVQQLIEQLRRNYGVEIPAGVDQSLASLEP